MRPVRLLLLSIIAVTAAACQSTGTGAALPPDDPAPAPTFSQPDRPVAYLNGQPLTQHELFTVLAEMDGGLALSEVLLDQAISQRLLDEGLTLSTADIDYERQVIRESLSDDQDEAARLLAAMRERRGLGERRYSSLLRRNAGLRKLVHGDITVGEAAIRQAYELRYGPRYTVRLILCDSAADAQQLRRRALGGASFIDLAVNHSTDPSAAQGGLLPPISPADATWPLALREQLPKLSTQTEEQRLSTVLTLGQGYAILRLEEVALARGPAIETVREALALQVKLRLERLRMEQLARTLVEGANIIVLDPTLKQSWEQQRGQLDAAGQR